MLSNCDAERLLRVSWTARRPNQSILKEIYSECSLEGLLLKLDLQYFGHLMRRDEKYLMLGKTEDKSSRGWQKMRWLDDSTDSMNVNLCKLQVLMEDKRACHAKVHRVARSQRQCGYWKTTIWQERSHFFQHRQCCKLDTCKPKINKIKSWRW